MKHLYLFTLLFSALGFSQTIALESFATGFSEPVDIVNAGDDRLFIVQQSGQIRVLNANGTTNASSFLNISTLVSNGSEQGLLGLAFHPNYATNGYFYVNYTNTNGDTVIARYGVSVGNPNVANTTATNILTIDQPAGNHNGGTIKFGPDGYLYIGMGDGGGGGDTFNNGQNKNTLLGKMLRIDVDSASPYGIPADNPYVGIAGSDEIWAIGMRNPWKFSFDSANGDLWIADVGQENVEEINRQPSTSAGLNYGWRCYEGNSAYNTSGCAAQNTMTFPLAVISSASGSGNCSITGGYVYRGTEFPNLQGKYVVADYCSNRIWTVNESGTLSTPVSFPGNNFTTFGVDNSNNLYVAGGSTGTIYKVIDTSLSVDELEKTGFIMAPNPAKSSFSLQTKNAQFPIELAVYDIAGKKLINKKLTENAIQIDVNELQSGLYIVTIEDNAGAKSSSKLTIQ